MALLGDLVAARSVNPPGDVTGPAAIAREWLRMRGHEPTAVSLEPAKPNIVALAHGTGNGPARQLVLNAHLDTVEPGDAALWSVDPLSLTRRDGRLYGLGTGNMKAAAAAMLHAFDWLARHRQLWSGRLALTLVADECVFGPAGTAHLLETRPDLRGDAVICGEGPGGMNLAIAEKGLAWVLLRAKGRAGQGMLTERAGSAPARLAAALVEIDAWNGERAAPPLRALDNDANIEGLRPSANVGRIGGDGFVSRAMSEAVAEIDVRIPPGWTLAEIHERFDRLCEDGAGLAWEPIKGWEPNWTDPDAAPVAAVRRAASVVRGTEPRPVTRLPASDGSRWRALGVPVVCYGPQPELASGIDDYVEERDLLDCIAVYALAALDVLASNDQTAE